MPARMTEGTEYNIAKEVAKGVKGFEKKEVDHLQSYLEKLNERRFSRGWFQGPAVEVETHNEFVQHVVGARDKSGDFKAQFLQHAKNENILTEKEAEAMYTKLFQHATDQYGKNIDRLRQQEKQARQEQFKVQERFSNEIEQWRGNFEGDINSHLERQGEKLESVSEQELRIAKQLALQSLKMEELQAQLSRVQDPGKRDAAFAGIMDKKIAEQLILLRQQAQQYREQDRNYRQGFGEILKTDVTAKAAEKVNAAADKINKAGEKFGKSMKEYFPTFTQWGKRAGVVGIESGKTAGRTAVNTAVTAGMISAELAKSSLNAAKKGAETFSDGFFNIVLVVGILLHVIQGMTGGWQGPSPVAFKWVFIFLLIYFVLLLGAPNSLSFRMRTFGFVCIFFAIEWQWFRIVNLLGIQTKWWTLKALWPTIVWYWSLKSIMNPGKKPIMTRLAILMILGFWVALGYSAINAGALIEKYTPAGLSDEDYSQQKTGFMITLAEKFGYDVSEFEQKAAEKCRDENRYYMEFWLDRGKIPFSSKIINDGYKKCVENNIVQLAEEKREKNEDERVLAAIEKETSTDFTKISFNEGKPRFELTTDPPKVVDSKKTVKSINTEVIYNIIYKTTFPDAELAFAAMLKKKGSKKEEFTLVEGSPAILRCLNIPSADCPDTEKSIEFPKDKLARYKEIFESGVDISASDIAKPTAGSMMSNVFVSGENTLRAAVIFTDRTRTTLPLIFATSDAVKGLKRTVEYDEEASKKNPKYEFRYWDQLAEDNHLPVDISSTYRNSEIEGVYSKHPAVIDIKPLNLEKPVIELQYIAILTWKTDIFNKNDHGKIVGINGIYLYLPAGITPLAKGCPFKRAEPKDIKEKETVLRYAYELEGKYLAALQDPNKLVGLSDIKDLATTGIPTCSTSIDQNKLFGKDTAALNLKEKFIYRKIIIELEYTYAIFKDTRVNIDYEIKPDLDVNAQPSAVKGQIDATDISISQPISGNAA